MRRIKARYIDGDGDDNGDDTEKSKVKTKKTAGKGKRKNDEKDHEGNKEVQAPKEKVAAKKAKIDKEVGTGFAEEV
jgi:hypothetical protein